MSHSSILICWDGAGAGAGTVTPPPPLSAGILEMAKPIAVSTEVNCDTLLTNQDANSITEHNVLK